KCGFVKVGEDKGFSNARGTEVEEVVMELKQKIALHQPERKDNPMTQLKIAMSNDKKIALVAHDNKKRDLVEWARFNRDLLAHHEVYATGTTGEILETMLGFPIHRLQSGPLGGDQQIGAKIVANEIDFLIFFWDPLEPMPHDPDVKALLRMAVVWNIPIACNRASADFMISSPLMDGAYDRLVPDYTTYRTRTINMDEPMESSNVSGDDSK
ncbi:MAG TPA: methylglyoxal synthase, partial [Anaerolineales bacterium]|nr:methylglyoxal synthase [Anaerolineales bacterium]